ncbi:MAG: hypothetical protein ABJP06_05105 [Sulfitobacter sp.]
MKPNFALSLSFDGITLLHRAAGGWREVGDVSISSDDLAGELAVLRKTATSLEPGGVRSKLVIPSSQIKYLSLTTPGLSDAARRKEAERALDGATPYEVADLAYDISVDGPLTHVAAVARETLAEAEAFANEHRFHPVSFVAIPEESPFLGEPFFGPTEGAAELLGPSDTVEPDGIAVVVVGAVRPEDTVKPATEPDTADAPAPSDAVEKDSADTAPVKDSDTPTKASSSDKGAADKATPDDAAPSESVEAPAADSEPAKTKEDTDTAAPAGPAETDPAPAPVQKTTPAEEKPAPQPELDLASAAEKPATAKPAEPQKTPPTDKEPLPPEPAKPALKTKDAEQAPADMAPAETAPPKTGAAAPTPEQEPAVTPLAAAAVAAVPKAPAAPKLTTTGFATRRAAPATPPKPLGGAQRPAAAPAIQTSGGTAAAVLQPDSSSLTQAPPASQKPASTAPAKAGFFSRRKPRKKAAAPIPAATAKVPPAGTEADRMTVFGARASDVRGKPRFLGLILTVILLVFLAGVAAWAAVFLDDGIAGLMKKDAPRATASAPENQITPEIIRAPDGIAQISDEEDASVALAALDPVLSAEQAEAVADLNDPRPEPVRPVITEAEAAARYAVTGIWPLSPQAPLTDPSKDPTPAYLSSIDARTGATDAIALPSPNVFDTDTPVAAVASPPPFGQAGNVDAAGLIIPTPEGIVAPGGYTLIAARPPLKPPAKALGEVEAAPEVNPVLAALASARPKYRPLGLAERSERAALGGVSRIELAAFRPSLRPQALQERILKEEAARQEAARKAAEAEQARIAAAAQASAVAALNVPQATQAAVAAPALQNATRLAAARSLRPDTRPRNFARIVKRAQRAKPAETRVASAASVAPRTVSPSLPSQASVTRSATVKNAINLRKVNLIGVYGKPASRRALVRLSNGRYQKVKVGDRIDGGRVAAIDASELRYVKSGRNVVLRMP